MAEPQPKLLKSADQIRSAITKNKFAAAIYQTHILLLELKEKQQKILEKFFPIQYEAFVKATPEFTGDPDTIGVLCAIRYLNPVHQTIDVNIVFWDSSINEYLDLVRNPKKVAKQDHLSLVKMPDSIGALERFLPDQDYCERNIVLSDRVMVNVIVNGAESKKRLEGFCKMLDLKGIGVGLRF